ncbi:MAG: hypothetical protein R2712_21300 [Vicinamibacterales bacterium]
MHVRWAVHRHDHLFDAPRDIGRVHIEQQAGGDERQPHTALSQSIAQPPQVLVQQRLTTGQHHALDAQVPDRVHVWRQVGIRHRHAATVRLPDVTHHASAIAARVHVEGEDGQAAHASRDAPPQPPRQFRRADGHAHSVNPGSCNR